MQPARGIVLGPVSVLAFWGFDVLRMACAASSDPVTVQNVDRGSGDTSVSSADGRATVRFAHFPTQEMLNEASSGDAPTILFLDDPLDSVRFVTVAVGCSPADGVRVQSAALAGYAQLCECPNVLVIHRAMSLAKPFLDAALAHLDLALTPEQRKEIADRFFGPESERASLENALKAAVAHYEHPERVAETMSAEEGAFVGQVVTPMVRMAYVKEPDVIVWPTGMFLSGDRPQLPASRWTDITGAARVLYHGPYLHLPAGLWRVRLLLAFSREACKLPFSAEVAPLASPEILAQVTMICAAKGVYEGNFEFENFSALRPLEVRIRVDRGAIDGFFALGCVELRRATRAADVAPAAKLGKRKRA